MPPLIENLMSMGFGAELIYSFVIIVCSLMIYFGTKELYELSSYKGIKYFRLSFLFFAVAYFFRSFIKFVLVYFNIREIHDFLPILFFGNLTLFVFMYFSSLAIFYLLYSVMWKKWGDKKSRLYLFYLIAFIVSFAVVFSRNSWIYLGVNIALFIITLAVVSISKKDKGKKKRNNLHTIYLLLSFFLILNIIDILIPEFFQTLQFFVYLASEFIFLLILYRVLKKAGAD